MELIKFIESDDGWEVYIPTREALSNNPSRHIICRCSKQITAQILTNTINDAIEKDYSIVADLWK